MGRFDREQESSHGDIQDAMEEEMESGGRQEEYVQKKDLPIATFHPTTRIIQINMNSEKALVCNYQTWDPTTTLIQAKKLFNEESVQTSQADREQEVLGEEGILDDKKEEEEVVEDQMPTDKFVVHGREGAFLMDKDKWPKLLLPHELEKQMVDSELELECVI
jgi:hypothetical protein